MIQELTIKLKLTHDEEDTNQIKVLKMDLEISMPKNGENIILEKYEHKLKETEIRYGILVLGAGIANQYWQILSPSQGVQIYYNSKEYYGKFHKTIKGRIDGLTSFFRENNFSPGNRLTITAEGPFKEHSYTNICIFGKD
jgi:hypothetical protein